MLAGKKKVLLLYITALSGHHRAAMAVEKALKTIAPQIEIHNVNSFNYTNPILEKIINRTYMGVIKKTPEVWEYLYDNPRIVKNTQRLKEMIHRYNSHKMKALIEDFKPDTIACTQAFPCGMVADYKTTHNSSIPLIGILTDFYPHSYWLYEMVDRYVVASDKAKIRLSENGISPDKISILGIPIDIGFNANFDKSGLLVKYGLSQEARTILIMGGSSGLGPIYRIVSSLDKIHSNVQLIIVTGTNIKLYRHLMDHINNFKKKIVVFGYVENMSELMSVPDLIITKGGGLTLSEALAKSLPIIIINPIPGQEEKNSCFLLEKKVALKAENEGELAVLVDNLCSMPYKLESMRKAAAELGKPDSALNIAKMILEI